MTEDIDERLGQASPLLSHSSGPPSVRFFFSRQFLEKMVCCCAVNVSPPAVSTYLHRHIAPRVSGYTVMIAVAAIINAFVATTYQPPDLEPVNVFPVVSATDASNAVPLQWTAPGDDAATGTATSYQIRYSTSTLSEGTWSSATAFSAPPTPRVAGTAESTIVTGLTPKTAYSFGMKTVDEVGNVSSLSNVISVTTACFEAWTVSAWGACVSGAQARTAVDQNDCGTTADRPALTQSCTCTEVWSCSDWSVCTDGAQTRTCTDAAACGTTVDKPEEEASCGSGGSARETSLVAATNKGTRPLVRVLTKEGVKQQEFLAYERTFRGGVQVAVGDLDGDGIDEIVTAPGKGRLPTVKVFEQDGTLRSEFLAFRRSFRGGINLAVGDLDDDGRLEIVVAPASQGSAHVRIFSNVDGRYRRVHPDFFAYGETFRGGIFATIADVDGNGQNEIVTVPGKDSGPHVRIFELIDGTFQNRTLGFFAYSSRFRGGVSLAAGNLSGDGKDEILTSPISRGGPHIRFFGRTSAGRFRLLSPGMFVFHESFRGGVSIATGDFDSDPTYDEFAVAVRSEDRSLVKIFSGDGRTKLQEFLAFPASMRRGVTIATGNFANDF